MMVWIIVFITFLLVTLGMAVGLFLSGKPVSGSCGGLGSLGLKEDCPICGKTEKIPLPCDQETGRFYDAMKSESSNVHGK